MRKMLRWIYMQMIIKEVLKWEASKGVEVVE